MKSTGIIRKVDDLGRIVLPIELRRTLDISERDELEIYMENDRIILVDYKTDRIEEGSLEEHVDRYRPQIKAYAIALREMIGKAVSQAFLCFLDVGQSVEVPLNEA